MLTYNEANRQPERLKALLSSTLSRPGTSEVATSEVAGRDDSTD